MNKSHRVDRSKKIRDHYASDESLVVRIRTHEIYTVPRVNFPEWVLDRITWLGIETVLDVGCGSASYTGPTRDRCSHYIAADLSLGMLRNRELNGTDRLNLDAIALPFRARSIDVILANHMLYHVPDLVATMIGFRRVLKPAGKLVAATNSDTFMHQINEIIDDASLSLGGGRLRNPSRKGFFWPFSLENGRDQLLAVFDQVTLHELHSELVFPRTDPVIAYIDSARELYRPHIKNKVSWQAILSEVERRVQEQIDAQGTFRVIKHNGVFVCQN